MAEMSETGSPDSVRAFRTSHRQTLLSMVNPKINLNDDILTDESITQILLYGDERLTPGDNKFILRETMDYFRNTGRFSQP